MQSINYDQSRVTNLHQIKTSFGLQNRQKQRSWNTGANKKMYIDVHINVLVISVVFKENRNILTGNLEQTPNCHR
jgi:hypothetical protein